MYLFLDIYILLVAINIYSQNSTFPLEAHTSSGDHLYGMEILQFHIFHVQRLTKTFSKRDFRNKIHTMKDQLIAIYSSKKTIHHTKCQTKLSKNYFGGVPSVL